MKGPAPSHAYVRRRAATAAGSSVSIVLVQADVANSPDDLPPPEEWPPSILWARRIKDRAERILWPIAVLCLVLYWLGRLPLWPAVTVTLVILGLPLWAGYIIGTHGVRESREMARKAESEGRET